MMDEAQLIRRWQRGDDSVVPALMRLHRSAIRRKIRYMGLGADWSDDVAAFAFSQLARYIQSIEPEAGVLNWILTTVTRRCIDLTRRQRCTLSLDHDFDQMGADVATVSGEAVVMARAEQAAVREALRALPREDAEPVVLVDIMGLIEQDAAAILGTSVREVSERRARGHDLLRAALAS